MAERIETGDFEEKVLRSERPVLVEFYGDSCIACRKMSPELASAEKALKESCFIYKVNTNYQTELAEKYNILANPTLIIFQNGQELARKTGVQKAQELLTWLKTEIPF